MSTYARPGSVEEALELLTSDGAAVLAGGTDLAGQIDRGIRSPSLLVDLQDAGLGGIDRRRRRRPDRRHDDARRARRLRAARAVRGGGDGRRPRRLAAPAQPGHGRAATSASTRAAGTTAARSGPAGSAAATPAYAQIGDHRKHNLEEGDCISAHPSDLAPALAACGATVVVRSRDGERELPLLELYRRPTEDNRSLVALAVGEIVVAVRLPPPPEASVYLRAGERQAFSFPLVSVARRAHGRRVTLAAAGVANIPRALDPADPLAGLPGHPQSAWKRDGARDARRARLAALAEAQAG